MIDLRNYSVRLGSYSDAAKILELINLVQPQDPWTLPYFDWQYFGYPPEKTMIFLIFHKDELVSLYVAVAKKIQFYQDVRDGFMIQDVMTHPDHRGQGFLHHLSALCTEAILKNGALAYTFPNKLSENSFRRNGWTELSKIPLRIWAAGGGNNVSSIQMDPVNCFDDRVTEIWEHSNLKIGIRRDCSFLNWRYSRPHTEYHKFYVMKDQGFLVLKTFSQGSKLTLHLLDLVLKESATQQLNMVLGFVKNFALIHHADCVTCWLDKSHEYADGFDQAGFCLDQTNDRYCFVTAPAHELDMFSNSTLWHLSQGDSDIY